MPPQQRRVSKGIGDMLAASEKAWPDKAERGAVDKVMKNYETTLRKKTSHRLLEGHLARLAEDIALAAPGHKPKELTSKLQITLEMALLGHALNKTVRIPAIVKEVVQRREEAAAAKPAKGKKVEPKKKHAASKPRAEKEPPYKCKVCNEDVEFGAGRMGVHVIACKKRFPDAWSKAATEERPAAKKARATSQQRVQEPAAAVAPA